MAYEVLEAHLFQGLRSTSVMYGLVQAEFYLQGTSHFFSFDSFNGAVGL